MGLVISLIWASKINSYLTKLLLIGSWDHMSKPNGRNNMLNIGLIIYLYWIQKLYIEFEFESSNF